MPLIRLYFPEPMTPEALDRLTEAFLLLAKNIDDMAWYDLDPENGCLVFKTQICSNWVRFVVEAVREKFGVKVEVVGRSLSL